MRITDDDLRDVRRLLRRMAVLDHAPHRVNSADRSITADFREPSLSGAVNTLLVLS